MRPSAREVLPGAVVDGRCSNTAPKFGFLDRAAGRPAVAGAGRVRGATLDADLEGPR